MRTLMSLYVLCAITGPRNADFGELGCVVCNYRPSECGHTCRRWTTEECNHDERKQTLLSGHEGESARTFSSSKMTCCCLLLLLIERDLSYLCRVANSWFPLGLLQGSVETHWHGV